LYLNQINFVIATESEFNSASSKIQSAISKNLTIVSPAFIDACLKADQLVAPAPFVHKATAKKSTATNNAYHEEDKMIIVSEVARKQRWMQDLIGFCLQDEDLSASDGHNTQAKQVAAKKVNEGALDAINTSDLI
jgi:hypothetical protein